MEKRLDRYKKLNLMNINIKYGEESIRFNLYKELQIDNDLLNDELKAQPSQYGFLLMLQKRLQTRFETLKQDRKAMWARLYMKGKEKTQGSSSRYYTEDMAKAYADSHKSYVSITKECIQAKDDADTIYAAVKSFEQRKDVMQTIASNTRKQF